VTGVEDLLRAEMRTEAERVPPDSIRPLRVPEPRRQSRTVRWLAPLAAAAAIAGVIAGVTIAGRGAGNLPNPQAPAGTPKYYVTLNATPLAGKFDITAVVRSSTDGAPVDSVQLLRSPIQPISMAGAANDRAFLVSLAGRLEIIRLAADGHVRGVTRLPDIPAIDDLQGVVLSPDGTQVVVAIGPPYQCKSCAHGIAVYSVTTGVTRKWLMPSGNDVSFSPVNWPDKNGHEVFLSGGLGYGYRLLDVSGPGGSLLASSRPVHQPGPLPSEMRREGWVTYGSDSWLMPGDKTVFTAYARLFTVHRAGSTESIEQAAILETSASTGRLVRVLATFSARVPPNAGIGCLPVSLGPAGVHALVWFANGFGRLDGTRFTPLPAPSKNLDPTLAAAW